MKPLHQILPELESAVSKRIADPFIQQLDAGELRGLVYKLVEGYQRRLADPMAMFETMVTAANDRQVAVAQQRDEAVKLRTEILLRVLRFAARAMPMLGSQIRTSINRGGGGDQQYTMHPLLRGIELAANRKVLSQADGSRAIVGRSWWVVALAGGGAAHDARWAMMDHSGALDAKGLGEETITITLTTPSELATLMHDRVVGNTIISLAAQLRDIDDGRVNGDTAQLRTKLEAALRILQPDDRSVATAP